MTFKKCKVVMLPTEKGSYIHRRGSVLYCTPNIAKSTIDTDYHLYILSDEEIKPAIDHLHNSDHEFGYYYVTKPDGNINTDYSANGIWYYAGGGYYGNNIFRKIIVTTDPELNLPRPPDSFIRKYCELGGIDEVMVEIIGEQGNHRGGSDFIPWVKISSDNTITIKKVKDSWSREELIKLCESAYNCGGLISDSTELPFTSFNEWIDKNL